MTDTGEYVIVPTVEEGVVGSCAVNIAVRLRTWQHKPYVVTRLFSGLE